MLSRKSPVIHNFVRHVEFFGILCEQAAMRALETTFPDRLNVVFLDSIVRTRQKGRACRKFHPESFCKRSTLGTQPCFAYSLPKEILLFVNF